MFFVKKKNTYIKEINGYLPSYSFRKPKEGYLVYKHSLKPTTRKSLTNLLNLIKWLIDKREENRNINKTILRDLELPENVSIKDLDSFYKKEFRKRKYIYSFKKQKITYLKEPNEKIYEFFPKKSEIKEKTSAVEFFKSIGEKNSQQ